MSETPEAPWVIHLVNGTRRLAKEASIEVEGVSYDPVKERPNGPYFVFIPWHQVLSVMRYHEVDVQAALEQADIDSHVRYRGAINNRKAALEEASLRG